MPDSERMSPGEIRASASLASIYGLRMLGMFLILPVFSIYAATLPGGDSHLLIGLALGAYGLTQALLQLPFGIASDHFGRKRVIYFGLLLFAAGSLIAALATDIHWVIVGRAIQGAGAVSAAVTALVADLTREEHRTKAMSMIGGTIGMTFAFSMVAGPVLNQWVGVPGIFALTGVLAILAIGIVKYVVPDPGVSRFHSDAEAAPAKLGEVLAERELLRLDFGIFALHAAQMAMFVVMPFAIKEAAGLDENHHWQIYLPVVALSLLCMVPVIVYGEHKAKLKVVLVAAVVLMLAAQLAFAAFIHLFWGIIILLLLYFIAFNVLETILPSLITKFAAAASKGTAIGVYNTAQSLGVFLGGLAGGSLSHHFGFSAVFLFSSVLMGLWLVLAIGMRDPPAVKSRMFHLGDGLDEASGRYLAMQLKALRGVHEVAVLHNEGVALLKVDMRDWDKAAALRLIGKGE